MLSPSSERGEHDISYHQLFTDLKRSQFLFDYPTLTTRKGNIYYLGKREWEQYRGIRYLPRSSSILHFPPQTVSQWTKGVKEVRNSKRIVFEVYCHLLSRGKRSETYFLESSYYIFHLLVDESVNKISHQNSR